MLQILRSISNQKYRLLPILILGLATSCKTPAPKPAHNDNGVDKDGQSYYTKVFYYSYELVWRAAQLSVKYPVAVNNMDNGVLETEFIKSSDGFISPLAEKEPSAGYRYKLAVNMVKGRVDGRNSVRVTIRKKIEKQKDFFSDVETINSDGLEERVLLYRIEREIQIDEAIKKSAKSTAG